MSNGYYPPYLPDQEFLHPSRLCKWFPADRLVYFVSNSVVDELDPVSTACSMRQRAAWQIAW
jgi:hypothetical protein